MNTDRGCHNCVHRYGSAREYWKCSRTGLYTDTEMRFGSKCSKGQELLLWAPRRSMVRKLLDAWKSTPSCAGDCNQGRLPCDCRRNDGS